MSEGVEQPELAAERALTVVERRQPMLGGLQFEDQERVARYMERASADATLRAYRSDWRIFETWCAAKALVALPATPPTAAAFLTDLADQGLARLRRR